MKERVGSSFMIGDVREAGVLSVLKERHAQRRRSVRKTVRETIIFAETMKATARYFDYFLTDFVIEL